MRGLSLLTEVKHLALAYPPLACQADTHEADRLPLASSELTVNTARPLGFPMLHGVDSLGRASRQTGSNLKKFSA